MSLFERRPDPLDLRPTGSAPGGRRRACLGALCVLCVGVLGLAACGDDDGGDVRDSACSDTPASGGSASGGSASGGSASGGSASGGSASQDCEASAAASGSTTEAACETVGDPHSADTTVAVTLDEFSVAPEVPNAPAGTIAFETTNEGDEPHELVVARGRPDDIRLVDGAPDEDALGDDLIGEIEKYPAGESCSGAFELAAGDYVLFCALVETEEDGTVESHFAKGMVTTFSVD